MNEQFNPQNYPQAQVAPEFTIASDIVPLPSKGIFYPNGLSEITIEHMTCVSENILTSSNLINSGRVLEELLKRQVKDRIDIDSLLTGDINAILLQLRIGAYGHEYPVKVTDPETGVEFDEVVDLTRLKFKELTVMPDENLLFSFNLPIRKKLVKFRLLSSKEEKQIALKSEEMKKHNGQIDSIFTERLKAQIMEIDGNKDKLYISRFVDAMPPLDALKLRNYIMGVEPNLDLSYEFTNPGTGRRFRYFVFLGPRLFYPEA